MEDLEFNELSEFFNKLSEFNDKKLAEREKILSEINEAVKIDLIHNLYWDSRTKKMKSSCLFSEKFTTVKTIMDSIFCNKEFDRIEKKYYNPKLNISWSMEDGRLPNQDIVLRCFLDNGKTLDIIWTTKHSEEFEFNKFRYNDYYVNSQLTNLEITETMLNRDLENLKNQIICGIDDISGYIEALKENILQIIEG